MCTRRRFKLTFIYYLFFPQQYLTQLIFQRDVFYRSKQPVKSLSISYVSQNYCGHICSLFYILCEIVCMLFKIVILYAVRFLKCRRRVFQGLGFKASSDSTALHFIGEPSTSETSIIRSLPISTDATCRGNHEFSEKILSSILGSSFLISLF